MALPRNSRDAGNVPVYALVGALVMAGMATAVAIFAPEKESTTTVVAIFSASIPALIAAAFAERASRDIRNGVVKEKAKHGAAEALDEAMQRKPSTVAVQAVSALLKQHSEQGEEAT